MNNNGKIKSMVDDIVKLESNRLGITINLTLITKFKYFINNVLFTKKNATLISKILELITLAVSEGFFNYRSKEIFIFKSPISNQKIYDIKRCVYHEIAHLYQETTYSDKLDTYEGFIREQEKILIIFNNVHYLKFHDEYYFEIMADLYAFMRQLEDENFDNIILRNAYVSYEKMLMLSYYCYDFESFFLKLVDTVTNSDVDDDILLINTLFEDKKIKNIDKLLEDEVFNNFDMRIKYLILSSSATLKGVDFNKLNKDTLLLLEDAIDYAYNLKETQKPYIKIKKKGL